MQFYDRRLSSLRSRAARCLGVLTEMPAAGVSYGKPCQGYYRRSRPETLLESKRPLRVIWLYRFPYQLCQAGLEEKDEPGEPEKQRHRHH